MPPNNRAYGPTVRAVRHALGKTLTDVAATAGLSKGYWSKVEANIRRPEAEPTTRIAAALGVPVEVLTGQLPVIATLRDAASIDPGTFARDVGLTIGRLERIERGTERPHSDTLDLIATRLGVEVDALSAKPAPPRAAAPARSA